MNKMFYFIILFFKVVFKNIYLILIFLAASGLSGGTRDLRCGMWDLSLWCVGFSLVEAHELSSCGTQA